MIAVDWGSSSLRAYRLDSAGVVTDQKRSGSGVLACDGNFAAALAPLIAAWNDADIVLCGMIGSRGGWFEQPYRDCPAGIDELAAAMAPVEVPEFPQRRLWFVPGVADRSSTEVPDVMRGEETQICALLDLLQPGTHVLCLPGTHSKWVTVRDGKIVAVATAMTGETYAVMRQHSMLSKSMSKDDSRFDAYAFDAGLRRSADVGGLLHHLFGVRTLGLFDRFSEAALPSYLSGLLIGHEVRASGLFSRTPRPAQVHLIGNERLIDSYARTLVALGVGVQRHSENLAAHGMHRLSRSLIPGS
jgi:2-dehydro-3-deoxygalactonokinase